MAVTLIIDWLSVLIKHSLTLRYVPERGLLPTTEELLLIMLMGKRSVSVIW